MDAEELQHTKELIELHKKRKRGLEKQAARYGIGVDPRILDEIEELTQEIARLEQEISAFEDDSRRPKSEFDNSPRTIKHGIPLEYVRGRPWFLILLAAASLAIFWFSSLREQPSVSSLEAQLKSANIELSGPGATEERKEEVRGFLKGPKYQALANLCLQVLNNRRFLNVVYLDTINGHYTQQFTGSAADTNIKVEQFNDVEKLKKAILEHWNQLHPNRQATSFDDIVEPKP